MLLSPVSGTAANLRFNIPVLPTFEFSHAAVITVDNAQTSFAVKVNGRGLGFRYFKSDAHTVTLYLNWPLENDDVIEISVSTTGQVLTAHFNAY